MILKDRLRKDGDVLFKYRSYLPLLMFIAFFATMFSFGQNLLDEMGHYNEILIVVALLVGLVGQGIRVCVAGFAPARTSGRNTKGQVAKSVNKTGVYSLCRNPLYLGNFFMMFSPILLLGNWLFALFFAMCFWLYYERIIYAEEAFLSDSFSEEYLEWANNTPAFFPRLSNYKKNILPFSMKSMLRREYSSLFGLLSSLFFTHVFIAIYAFDGLDIRLEPILSIVFVVGAIFYIAVRIIVKTTNIMQVEGR